MILQQHTILFVAIFVISLIGGHASIKFSCNRTCGTSHLPYPFGFSANCDIHLNCSPNGDMLINEFPVQIVGQDTIKINLEPRCDRPVEALYNLSTKNYAPKSTNAILLNNCTSGFSPCSIPSISVRTHFESLNCSNNSSVSCFSKADTANGFFDYNMANISQCKYLLSSISAESFTGSGVSLETQMMELWWWLQGDCRCSKDANCTKVESPAGSGFRCQCRDGLIGDGYLAGVGCRKGCNPAKYLSGQCGAGARPAVLDYTVPDLVNDNADLYCRVGVPFVMGTTGGDRDILYKTVDASKVYAVISPQMGKQVVAFLAAMEIMAEQFPGAFSGYSLHVKESHQAGKLDTSGTAKAVISCFKKLGVSFDDQIEMIRDPKEQVQLVGVPEEYLSGHAFHLYYLSSPDKTVSFEFQHNVCGRSIYAEGTVDAVLFLAKKIQSKADKRIYDMIDVLREGNMR